MLTNAVWIFNPINDLTQASIKLLPKRLVSKDELLFPGLFLCSLCNFLLLRSQFQSRIIEVILLISNTYMIYITSLSLSVLFVLTFASDNAALTYSKFDLLIIVNHLRGSSSNEVGFKAKIIEQQNLDFLFFFSYILLWYMTSQMSNLHTYNIQLYIIFIK